MRNVLLLVMVVLGCTTLSQAQIVDGVNLKEKPEIEYLEILGLNQGVFKKKITILVDYGQKINIWDSDTRVEDEAGTPIIFNSMMDGVNFFAKNGWELQFAYAVTVGNSGSTYHYVFHRKTAAKE